MKKCTNCGMVNEDYANYCNYCGKQFNTKTQENKSYNENNIDNSFEINHSQYSGNDENKVITLDIYLPSYYHGVGYHLFF